MFDIKKLAIQSTGVFHVKDAHGVPQFDEAGNPVTITAHSPGTRKAAQAQFAKQSKVMERLTAGMGGKSESRTEEEDRKERAEFLAGITQNMSFDFDGGPRALFQDLPLGHIANDYEKWWNERGNFAPGSAANVSNMSATQPG